MINHNCSGWMHLGRRNIHRSDDGHAFTPELLFECHDDEKCQKPSYHTSEYPHKHWPSIPMVKSSDLLFRVTSTFSWDQICFRQCTPSVLYRNTTHPDVWNELPFASLPFQPFNLMCMAKPKFDGISFKDNVYYIWYPADRCYPHHGRGQRVLVNDLFLMLDDSMKNEELMKIST